MAANPSAVSAHRWQTVAPTALSLDSRIDLSSGNQIPVLGLGTWQLKHQTVDSIAHALELGYRLIDTAGDYHTQRGIGEALRAHGVARRSIYLVTKIEETDDALEALRRNLHELKLEYADLVLVHRPPEDGVGEALWRGLRRARNLGLARDIGVSNYSIERLEELAYRTGEIPAVNQIEWSPYGHSPNMLEFCRDNGILLQAYSPLTHGARLSEEKLGHMAARYGKTAAQLIIRWNLQSGVVPLPKANQKRHQLDNLSVFDFEITVADMGRLNALNEHYSALGKLHYT